DIDEKKSKKALDQFEKIAKNYPYKEDLKTEREFIQFVDHNSISNPVL
ncbi:MAG: hypothetical protein HUJ53_00605, partial [Holdemanella sp.]|nr:hypothetical protein [Holdemanella sp.]